MSFQELVISSLPALLVAVAVVFGVALYTTSLVRYREEYRSDRLRLDLERQMADLVRQMQADRERFESVNHLLLEAQSKTRRSLRASSTSGVTEFLRQLGVNPKRPVDPRLVLVLTPFNPMYDESYRAIKQSIGEAGFQAVRGDETNAPGNILSHIMELMVSAKLVIANITGRNPNVFYELGIAHAMGKPVLIISEATEDIPFDIQSTRIMTYHDDEDLAKNLKNWLPQVLARVDDVDK